jgi:hypothetical protein
MPVERRELGESLLDPLVRVAEPFLEAQHLLADDREAEVTGLDDARVHRPTGISWTPSPATRTKG